VSVRIGVVDSGFRENQSNWIADSAAFYLLEGDLWMGESSFDVMEHGARILDIIKYHYPDGHFYSAQVFDNRGVTTPAQVAAAIDWLCEQKVQLINLSLGLRQDREVLADSVNRAVSKGIVISASSPARGDPVYPSAYEGAFRMTGDARCNIDEITCLETEFADFGGHVLGLDQEQAKAGASLGCAHMSGHLAKILAEESELDLSALAATLKQRAHYFGPERRFK
jgi:hypothetical protein